MPYVRKRFFITGSPGTGKSRLIREGALYASHKGLKVIGFYTPEVRDRTGIRVGFDFDVIGYGRIPLARKNANWPLKFGQYSINPEASKVYRIIMSTLEISESERTLLVLDEIGPMELKLPDGYEFFASLLKREELTIMGVYHRRLNDIAHSIYLAIRDSITYDLDRRDWNSTLMELKKWIDLIAD